MYFDDHDPPHIHAIYGDDEAQFRIDEIGLLKGTIAWPNGVDLCPDVLYGLVTGIPAEESLDAAIHAPR